MSKTINELCELYGSDKCPKIGHSYAPFYDKIFKNKKKAKAILELGAGSPEVMERYAPGYKTCCSLFVWRDYFPKAEIYGLDVKDDCAIVEDRIHVVIGDQHDARALQKLVDMAGKFDIIIDDCSHQISDQIYSASFLLRYLKPKGIYIIEDVYDPEVNFERLKDVFMDYDVRTYEFTPNRNDCLAVIRKK